MTADSKNLAIEIKSVCKSYRAPTGFSSKLALDQVSLKVAKGEIFGFLGPNGAGKTSLIKILVGIMRADAGSAQIMGLDSDSRAAKSKFGYLPERPYFHDFLTAKEFLMFHGRLLGMQDHDLKERIPKLLKKVDLLRGENQRLRSFSKGMLQRVGFAQALLHDPDVLILDEPMSGLDPVGRREVRDIITEISMTGKTIFFSTHIIHDVEVICSTLGYIQGGKLQGSGNIESLLGKTVKSMEVRYQFPFGKDPHKHAPLRTSRKTMDGWVLDIEADAEQLEAGVNSVLGLILKESGTIRAVVPRKSTLEDLFFTEAKK
jgi:ABC-2 type transport system ATP-binding protein